MVDGCERYSTTTLSGRPWPLPWWLFSEGRELTAAEFDQLVEALHGSGLVLDRVFAIRQELELWLIYIEYELLTLGAIDDAWR